jgi:hypothetical protein
MKTLAAIFLLLAAAAAYGQSIKTLGFNTTNGVVVANTGTNVALTFTNQPIYFGGDFNIADGILRWGNDDRISIEDFTLVGNWQVQGSLGFISSTNAAATRTNLFGHGGISTNFVVGTNTLVFTNGILREIQ